MKKVFIWVNHQQRGVHCYPDAQTQDILKDVSYLGFKHHHMFMFKIGLEVFHDKDWKKALQWLIDNAE